MIFFTPQLMVLISCPYFLCFFSKFVNFAHCYFRCYLVAMKIYSTLEGGASFDFCQALIQIPKEKNMVQFPLSVVPMFFHTLCY